MTFKSEFDKKLFDGIDLEEILNNDTQDTSMCQFYKTVVMCFLLKNGDAYLKNFGVLYDEKLKNICFAPAYDIVTTTAYIYKDKPALSMFGKKVWFGKKELLKFGTNHC